MALIFPSKAYSVILLEYAMSTIIAIVAVRVTRATAMLTAVIAKGNQ